MVVEGVSNDTKGTKKNLVFNTCGAVCYRKMVVEGVSNDTKYTKKELSFQHLWRCLLQKDSCRGCV